jgi:hypothetical protein
MTNAYGSLGTKRHRQPESKVSPESQWPGCESKESRLTASRIEGHDDAQPYESGL